MRKDLSDATGFECLYEKGPQRGSGLHLYISLSSKYIREAGIMCICMRYEFCRLREYVKTGGFG